MAHGTRETEIKLPLASAAEGRRRLRAAGFRVSRARVFEANIVFDTADLLLRQSGRLLRLRQAGRLTTVTYKGPAEPGPHKTREEQESTVGEPRALIAVFERLGFNPVFRYEKYRTEFRPPTGSGVAMLDETPVGVYLELEGSARWIDRTARQLGFSPADYSILSYAQLYLDQCRRNGIEPSNMVFREH